MPTNLPVNLPGCPKTLKLTFLLLLSPLFFYAQSLTGLWTGTISNDSSTVRKDQSFEIALTEYRGKVYGYSRSEFIVDDVLYYIVKRVNGTIVGDICEVTDDEIISYNFPKLLDKKIKVTSTFRRDNKEGEWYLAGKWKTNETKKYYAVTGNVDLAQEKDLTASKIFPHLEELKLADKVAFYKERKEGTPIVKIAKPEKINTDNSNKADLLRNNNDVAISSPVIKSAQPGIIPANNSSKTSAVIEDEKSTAVKQEQAAVNETVIAKTTVDVNPKNALSGNETAQHDKVENPGKNSTVIANNQPEKNKTVMAVTEDKPVVTTFSNLENNTIVTKKDAEPINNTSIVAENKTTVTTNYKPAEKTAKEMKTEATENNKMAVVATTPKNNVPVNNKQDVAKNEQPIAKEIAKQNPLKSQTVLPAVTEKQNTTAGTKPQGTAMVQTTAKPEVPKETIAKVENKPAAVITIGTERKETVIAPMVDVIAKAAVIEGRKSEFSQVVNFKTDSITLALYDNGEIDGDTVSVYMNGEVLMANQGLKASAIRKTIYIPAGEDEFTLVMFAESLGKYPPNTGLLVIRDGDDVYNLRFSSDFQKSSGIVFKRKK